MSHHQEPGPLPEGEVAQITAGTGELSALALLADETMAEDVDRMQGTKRKTSMSAPASPEESMPKRVKADAANSFGIRSMSPAASIVASETPVVADTSLLQISALEPDGRLPAVRSVDGVRHPVNSRQPVSATHDRAHVSRDEEKKRGRRLFGGLLTSLDPNAKKPLRLSRRPQVERKLQDLHANTGAQTLQDIAQRERAQESRRIKNEEEAMERRHTRILFDAESLSTKNEPRILYRPWKLTVAQQDTIRTQVRQAQTTIDQELEDFSQKTVQRLDNLWEATGTTTSVDGETRKKIDSTNHKTAALPQVDGASESKDDDHGDLVVAEEDTVIY